MGINVPSAPQEWRYWVEEKQEQQQEQMVAGKRSRNGQKEQESALQFEFATELCQAVASDLTHSASIDSMLDRKTTIYLFNKLFNYFFKKKVREINFFEDKEIKRRKIKERKKEENLYIYPLFLATHNT